MAVEWLVNRCPACGSRKVKVRKTTHTEHCTVRLCKCLDCLKTWKAVEER